MNTIKSLFSTFWIWLINRRLEPEHIGMAGAIIVSTWHVLNHMAAVEAAAVVAVVMGTLLGFTNALAAMRYFESEDVRWPAGVTVLFSAFVSVWMQYGFYDNNSNLTPYMWGSVNASALAFGVWAPVIEIMLGWLYGARLKVRHKTNSIVDKIRQESIRQVEAIQNKLTVQLRDNQRLLDELHTERLTGQEKDEAIAARNEVIAGLQEKITELRVQNAGLDARLDVRMHAPANVQRPRAKERAKPGKMHADDRRQKLVELRREQPEASLGQLAHQLGVAKNTIKSDLQALQPAIHPNGHTHNGGAS